MKLFWGPVIRPVLEALSARRVIMIGGEERNDLSARLAPWCRRRQAHLEMIDPRPGLDVAVDPRPGLDVAVDPRPGLDVAAMQRESAGHVHGHAGRSLEVLDRLVPADAVLLDGDPNWHTVYQHLLALYGPAGAPPDGAPVVLCSNVAWPHGRRDGYRDPAGIPTAYRQPWRRGGLLPNSAAIHPVAGLSGAGCNAETEGGSRNGVRTAVEDALAGRREHFRIVWLDVLFGLAVIVPKAVLAARPALAALLDELEPNRKWRQLADVVEQDRIKGEIAREQVSKLGGGSMAGADVPAGRPFTTSLPLELSHALVHALRDYRYKGRRMLLNPFDLANYQAVLGALRPQTVFEIGIFEGGRTLWLADQLAALAANAVDATVVAVDRILPADFGRDGILALAGDATDLGTVLPDTLMARLPRPFLVIEDSAHDYDTTLAVLTFFHRHLRPGDYIVVEDGFSILLAEKEEHAVSSVSQAVAHFLKEHADSYEIDTATCDRFGYNATWNLNGWLRRIGQDF